MKLSPVTIPEVELPRIDWLRYARRFMNPLELETLVHLFRSVGATSAVEFGVNEGRTAKALLEYVPTLEHYVGIDVIPGYVTSKKVQRNEVPTRPGWQAENMNGFRLIISANGSLDLKAGDLPQCDAAFIDGDHGREAVMHDTALARACVRPGGIIVWHDYHDLGTVDVRECLHELRDAGADIKHVAGTWLAYELAPQGAAVAPMA